jgi:hypothetical protein
MFFLMFKELHNIYMTAPVKSTSLSEPKNNFRFIIQCHSTGRCQSFISSVARLSFNRGTCLHTIPKRRGTLTSIEQQQLSVCRYHNVYPRPLRQRLCSLFCRVLVVIGYSAEAHSQRVGLTTRVSGYIRHRRLRQPHKLATFNVAVFLGVKLRSKFEHLVFTLGLEFILDGANSFCY